jgi:hypothetical protein
MIPQFLRVCVREHSEVYISLHSISKIEVSYVVPDPNRIGMDCSLKTGLTDPSAIRIYTVFAGGEKYKLAANPGSRTMQTLEEIYKNAIKDD